MVKRLLSYVSLFLLVVPAGLPAPGFDDFDIEDEGLCPEVVSAAGRFGPLLQVMAQGVFDPQDLWDSDPFQSFLDAREKGGTDLYEEPALLAVYLDKVFATYEKPAKLVAAQDKALAEAIRAHGVELPRGASGREALVKLSAENRDRLLAGRPYQTGTIAAMREAEAIVATLSFQFTHNAPRAVARPEVPLVSSRQLQRMGFSGGLNTAPFNQWLKSDDCVFFYVHPAIDRGAARLVATTPRNMGVQYGQHQAELSQAYAEAAGWVSFYTMDVDDLIAFAKSQMPEEYREAVRLLDREFNFTGELRRPFDDLLERRGLTQDQAWGLVRGVRGLEAVLQRVRDRLHALDFTATDFRILLRQALLFELNAARRARVGAFREAMQLLRAGTARDLRTVLDQYAFGPLGIPNDYELKIPVAVPHRELHE